MGSLSEEEFRFFDATQDIASTSCANANDIEIFDPESATVSGSQYDVWIRSPGNVKERRSKFFDLMGLSLDEIVPRDLVDESCVEGELDRMRDTGGAVLRTSGFEEEFSSCRSSLSLSNESFDLSEELSLKEKFVSKEENSGGGAACNVDELGQDGRMSEVCEMSSEQWATGEESETTSSSSTLYKQLREKEDDEQNKSEGVAKRIKNRWLNKLRSLACVVDNQGKADRLIAQADGDDASLGTRVQRVKVRQSRKRLKELSALYKSQDIQAHEGSILTMKFSPDGQYLASSGEDGVVRVWQVVENESCNDPDIPEIDPSCIYFTVNHQSQLKPRFMDKEKVGHMRSLRKTSDSACVIFPPKVFRILEKPLHEFRGHSGEVLDLSWSKNNYLLSSSEDKTVRLWQLGSDQCLRVFSHNNYVTCVQFNPVDDNFFISGSIDGKVRIWAISTCQVVDWTDIRDIVTAVCYWPDGQGGIVGSMTGTCRFYNMLDNNLQLDAEICLSSKKKSVCRRITGLQFSPQDSSKVMVTCADSQVRILQGLNVIGKYKGVYNNVGNQTSASFTSDGKHIVSACEDSNVYMWNFVAQENVALPKAKSIKSYERFSTNASIAIPWCGLKSGNSENGRQFQVLHDNLSESQPYSSPAYFSLSQEYILESFPKGAATWPEEKLPPSSPLSMSSAMHKSHYKFLKTSCQSTSSSHAWGLVIVTAGWDGRIRSFHNYGLPVAV
ncbi:hypothetical protein SLEP1_g34982 [Rubroshorea leprosula]|uniref:WD repeat-containing protein 44-like n=1 Tax=Rubroshorea leprosula TaxID=152421 RepID=A0AAV5KLT8_9ROSI|nr:hypothetical protein SLEP1_g34982 [Rubroshorea leprosula]